MFHAKFLFTGVPDALPPATLSDAVLTGLQAATKQLPWLKPHQQQWFASLQQHQTGIVYLIGW